MKRLSFFLLFLLIFGVQVQAQRPDAPEFALSGRYLIGSTQANLPDDERPIALTMWYPAAPADAGAGQAVYQEGVLRFSGRAIADAAPDLSGGPYPLVIFSHGSGSTRYQSLFFVEHLVSHGFVVIAVNHAGNTLLDRVQEEQFSDNLGAAYAQRPLDVLRTIGHAERINTEGDFSDLMDMERIAVVGHSFGGYTALAVAGARLNFSQLENTCLNPSAGGQSNNICFLLDEISRIAETFGHETIPEGAWPAVSDERIRAVVTWAPWNGPILDTDSLANMTVPALFIVGSSDAVTPPGRDAYLMYDRMLNSTPKALVTLENAGHYVFVEACNDLAIRLGLYGLCSDAVWDMARAHDLINHFSTAFLKSVLYEDEAAIAALQPNTVNFTGVDYEAVTQPVLELVPEIISVRPHDTGSFTQGLLLHDGYFYESAGLYGQSNLRQVDPQTGEVLRQVDLNPQFFAEGLALVDNRLIQLTWQENIAGVFDLESFELLDVYEYEGEGWGLCYDGSLLYMTDGSSNLFTRDPQTFALLETIPVTLRGQPVTHLNELECVGDDIYANVWLTDFIMQIDKTTGVVKARITAADLLTPEERTSADVLNGIAYDPENNVFFITGKLWPKLFEVRFVEAGE